MITDVLKNIALGVSSSCSDPNEICVKSLPRPGGVMSGSIVQDVLQVAIMIIAAVCVLFIVIGAVRYIVSQGDPQAVSKAKSTIVFALIGLAVTILAQGIVLLVVEAIT